MKPVGFRIQEYRATFYGDKKEKVRTTQQTVDQQRYRYIIGCIVLETDNGSQMKHLMLQKAKRPSQGHTECVIFSRESTVQWAKS